MSFESLVGQTIGQYQMMALLGVGGMGAVYRAVQTSLGREVAVKVMSPLVAEQEGYLERFNREARLSASLQHPHIVTIYDFGAVDDLTFVAMQLLNGGSLEQRMRQRPGQPPSLREVSDLLMGVSAALDYAHSRGIVHRDIKPANIVFDDSGKAYLVDFGIAKLVDATSGGLTGTGTAMGSPPFMPPEQWMGEEARPSSDQYSLAVTTYAALTGRLPFEATNTAALMYKHLQDEPTPLGILRPDLPIQTMTVLGRAMSKKPEDRWPNCTAFAEALRESADAASEPESTTGFFTFKVEPRPPSVARRPSTSQWTGAKPLQDQNTLVPPPSPPTEVLPADWKPPKPPQNNRGRIALILVAMVIVAAIGVLALLAYNSNQQAEAANATGTRIAALLSATPTPSNTPQPSDTPTATPTDTRTPTPTDTASPTATDAPTETSTPSPTATETLTVRQIAAATRDAVATLNTEFTALAAIDQTATATLFTPTHTPSRTPTATNTPTNTATATNTPSVTPTPTATETPIPSPTLTPTSSATRVPEVAFMFAEDFEDGVANGITRLRGGSWTVQEVSEEHQAYCNTGTSGEDFILFFGNSAWSAYTIEAVVRFEIPGEFQLIGRFDGTNALRGYRAILSTEDSGETRLLYSGTVETGLAQEGLTVEPGVWYTLRMEFNDRRVRYWFGDELLADVTDNGRIAGYGAVLVPALSDVCIDSLTIWAVEPPRGAQVGTPNTAANLRADPSTTGEVVGALRLTDQVVVLARTSDNRWLQVLTPSGLSAWVSAGFINLSGSITDLPALLGD